MSTYTDDLPLSTIEREAWQRGDSLLAAVAAQAADNEDAQTEVERLQDVVGGIRDRITEANWRTGKKAELRELVEAIIGELAEGGS